MLTYNSQLNPLVVFLRDMARTKKSGTREDEVYGYHLSAIRMTLWSKCMTRSHAAS